MRSSLVHHRRAAGAVLLLVFCLALPLRAGAAAFAAPTPLVQPGRTERFQPAACSTFAFDVPAGLQEPQMVECGWLSVPAEHANPDGPTIRLAVVILHSTGPSPAPDPLVMAQGGPGGSTIDLYLGMIASTGLLEDRDVILFDQRGTLYTDPNLYCSEIDQLTLDTLQQDLSIEESDRLSLQAMRACRQRLAAAGVNLSAYDSLENAADIEDLRQALGYAQINLYGVSYGTLLALHAMRLNPSGLRSVVLDGVLPPQTNFLLNSAQTATRSLSTVFQACAIDPGCQAAYPDLEQSYYDTLKRLNENPARISLTDMSTGQRYDNVVFNGDTLQGVVSQALYMADFLPLLPRMLADAQAGRFDLAGYILGVLAFDKTMSYGMYYSVLCAEDADFDPAEQDLSGVPPELARIEGRAPAYFQSVCQAWDVAPLAAEVDAPVQSDVPTLLLSGGFDPVTPPEYAMQAAEGLPNSVNLVFPTGSHGQVLSSDCANRIVRQFLNAPDQAPDSACINETPPLSFITPDNLVDLPLALRLLRGDRNVLAGLGLLSVSVLCLLSAWLALPLAWLVNRARGAARRSPAAPFPAAPAAAEPAVTSPAWPGGRLDDLPEITTPAGMDTPAAPRPGLLARWSSGLALLAGAAVSSFLLILTAILVTMVAGNDSRIFYGVAGAARPVFLLPWIFLLLALLMAGACLALWRSRSASPARRLYYTLLTLNAGGCFALLAWLGLLGR
ncbi:MAG: alpha/beta fold hydrolase [Chloroflexota bacterium]